MILFLVKVDPQGPTCHTGTDTCWSESNIQNFGFISELETIIKKTENLMRIQVFHM